MLTVTLGLVSYLKDLVLLWMTLLLSSSSLCSNYKAMCQNPEVKGIKIKVWMHVRSFQSSEHLAHRVLLTPKTSVSWFLFLHVLFNVTVKCRAMWIYIKQSTHCTPASLENGSTHVHRHRQSSPYSAPPVDLWTPQISVCCFDHLPQKLWGLGVDLQSEVWTDYSTWDWAMSE